MNVAPMVPITRVLEGGAQCAAIAAMLITAYEASDKSQEHEDVECVARRRDAAVRPANTSSSAAYTRAIRLGRISFSRL